MRHNTERNSMRTVRKISGCFSKSLRLWPRAMVLSADVDIQVRGNYLKIQHFIIKIKIWIKSHGEIYLQQQITWHGDKPPGQVKMALSEAKLLYVRNIPEVAENNGSYIKRLYENIWKRINANSTRWTKIEYFISTCCMIEHEWNLGPSVSLFQWTCFYCENIRFGCQQLVNLVGNTNRSRSQNQKNA